MRLCTQSRYGVRAVFDIAYHSGGLETQVKDISRRQGISPRYLEQIFQRLKRAGIVGSKRGPGGGYFLKKRPKDITIGDILRVTEISMDPVPCVGPKGSSQLCDRADSCVSRLVWKEANNRLRAYFDSLTVDELCRMARDTGLRRLDT